MNIFQIFPKILFIEDENDLNFCEVLFNQNIIKKQELNLNMAIIPCFIKDENIKANQNFNLFDTTKIGNNFEEQNQDFLINQKKELNDFLAFLRKANTK